MSLTAVTCPQCGGGLPRQAIWRTVSCPYCGATVTRRPYCVEAARLRATAARVQAGVLARKAGAWPILRCAGRRFHLLARVGIGENAEVHLAERIAPLPERIIVKLAHATTGKGVLAGEAATLGALIGDAAATPLLTQRLPQPIGVAVGETGADEGREVLLLRHHGGYWGSLAQVIEHSPGGVDPRHAVWIWRRALDVLAGVHAKGWTHGDLAPEHWLVHPRDHGILLVGWARAVRDASAARVARDLRQSAWTVRWLLSGGDASPLPSPATPPPLANLLERSSEDAAWCATVGAQGLDQALLEAARAAFGPPRFVHFNPIAAAGH
ncbi:protein kinase family protein [Accumulibacter sp.]|uniref:protein kinase family protein n=1 Tax=Accumulibacter sp. TaxID=2053492 RepID=UPI0026186579|nr:protein kinase family protein [Accumulibacter sp.]